MRGTSVVTGFGRRAGRFLGTAFLLAGLAGCGPGLCDVGGRIMFQGKTVVCGCVVFAGSDGITKTANINPDGTYLLKAVRAGPAQVAVFSFDPARPLDPYKAARTHGKDVAEPIDDSAINPDAARVIKNPPNDRSNWSEPNVDRSKWFPLPKKYELVATSGLTADLKGGTNEVNFDLK